LIQQGYAPFIASHHSGIKNPSRNDKFLFPSEKLERQSVWEDLMQVSP
ncbi:unnamed protein product, partial [Allacma fusca]